MIREARPSELREVAAFMYEQFRGKEQFTVMSRGIDPEKAEAAMEEFLFMQLDTLRSLEFFVYDRGGRIAAAMACVDGRKRGLLGKLAVIPAADKFLKANFTKDERKTFLRNMKVMGQVSSLRWYKKHCESPPYYLAQLAVGKDARGTGVCREMLEFLFTHARRTNRFVTLETHSPDNVPLYEHFGFALAETCEAGDRSITEYRMVKRL